MRLVRYTQNHRPSPAAFGSFTRSPWSGLESEIDRLFEGFLESAAPVSSAGRFPVDLYEDAHNTYVRAELPGLARDDINVELTEGYLTITATRKSGRDPAGESFTLTRSVRVPDEAVQTDKISAAHENGVLTVTLPKREETKPRKISIAVK